MKTKTAQHTPGPWKAVPNQMRETTLIPGFTAIHAPGNCGIFVTGENMEANARLIATAPELLEALQKMVDAFTGGTSMQHAVRLEAIEAIARAEGINNEK